MNQLPSFLCIGAQKAATSWLYGQLRQHPGIWLPPIKELHYFDHLYCPDNRSWTRWHIQQGARKLIKHQLNHAKAIDFKYVAYLAGMASDPMFTEAWYGQAFDRPAAKGRVLGDITPEYCAIGDAGIAHVKRLLGEVKIIWIIRDPVRRALSQLRMNAQRRGVDDGAPEEKWLELAASPEITNRGDYADYIPRWVSQFGPSGILFIPFQHIAQQPQAVLRGIESFVGVGRWDGYNSMDEKVHATRAYAIHEGVVAYFNGLFQPQYQFLQDYFADDFVKAI